MQEQHLPRVLHPSESRSEVTSHAAVFKHSRCLALPLALVDSFFLFFFFVSHSSYAPILSHALCSSPTVHYSLPDDVWQPRARRLSVLLVRLDGAWMSWPRIYMTRMFQSFPRTSRTTTPCVTFFFSFSMFKGEQRHSSIVDLDRNL